MLKRRPKFEHMITMLTQKQSKGQNYEYKPRQFKQLFRAPPCEYFQLQLLEASPHMNRNQAYTDIVAILKNHNDKIRDNIQNKHDFQSESQHIKILASLKLIYQQMLNISCMQENYLKANDYALKLKSWYQGLFDPGTLFKGTFFTKSKKSQIDRDHQYKIIRQSFNSNVYEEINDYARRKLVFQSDLPKDKAIKENRKFKSVYYEEQMPALLPHIDALMYKREQRKLNQSRLKKQDSLYFKERIINKNMIKQMSLKNFKRDKKDSQIQFANNKNQQFSKSLINFDSNKKKVLDSLIKDKSKLVKHKLSSFSSLHEASEKLQNINGINLMSMRY